MYVCPLLHYSFLFVFFLLYSVYLVLLQSTIYGE